MIIEIIKTEIENSSESRYSISQSTGVGEDVLSRLMNPDPDQNRGISLETAEKLLDYFKYKLVKETNPKGEF